MPQTKTVQEKITPQEVKNLLVKGNARFASGNMLKRDLLKEVKECVNGQYPHTVVLGCVDSRATAEQMFDQGIGDIFNTRVAGNVINDDVLGSLEFACKLAGSKLVVVLGHTHCGAVTAALEGEELGHVTTLLEKIKPAVETVKAKGIDVTKESSVTIVIKQNVLHSIDEIREKSVILREMEENNEIEICGAIYDIGTGVVDFL